MNVEAQVFGINRYLVKGAAKSNISDNVLVDQGIHLDRAWMIVDADGNFVTQREHPKLATIQPIYDHGTLVLTKHGEAMGIRINGVNSPGPRREVTIWGKQFIGIDDGDAVANWINRVLETDGYRLVHKAPESVRQRGEGYGRMEFPDSWPLTIASVASLEEVNRRIIEEGGKPVTMDRFRPNIVVDGCEAFAEDRWARIRINGVVIDVAGPRIRCHVTTIDQQKGVLAGKEPLRTLAKFRRTKEGEVVFAQKAANVNRGVIYVNADVEVLEEKAPPEFR